ncbi:AraC family transcriptional regulator [Escherichia coli]|uniref:AraC family transcriptional regulator n=1 Tax=Escherichia coli TaxID=562 RepID=UPI003B28031A
MRSNFTQNEPYFIKLTSISVTEIAYMLHYSSHQNFCRAFKKFTSRNTNSVSERR